MSAFSRSLLAVAGALFVVQSMMTAGRRGLTFLGGIALAAGGVLLIVAAHWGHFG